ncbi:Rha family transcriptional regulator [Acinetobacter lactucae]|uniref:Rha family transcriptional regulator n=1 Tax=Acinetobacter lactucae TaxID=1785128 RepID=UPI0034D357DA
MSNLNINTNNAVAINNTNNQVTMSSREIADLTNKRHPDVKRDIEVMVEQLNLDVSKFAHNYFDSMNRQQTEYELDKDLTTCLVSGYNVQLRMAIIKRWNELEEQAKQQFQLPTTFSQALLLAAQLEEQKEQLALQVAQQQQVIEHQQPTVDAYELLAGKKGSMCFQDAYKFLGGMKQKDMKEWMVAKGWIYIDRFNRVSASNTYLVNGYLKVKATTHAPQIRITYKGLAAMARQMKIKINAEDLEG